MWIYIVIGVVAIIAVYALAVYNSLVVLRNKVKEAFATMDVYLKKRWDLIPNIVETVKGYAAHEKSVFEEVVQLRNNAYDTMSDENKIKANEQLSAGITKIMAVAENYPELKSNENFKDLSNQLAKIEEDIANSRKYYNAVVRNYNNKIEMFPSNIFASMFGHKTKEMFEINSEERQNVQVKF